MTAVVREARLDPMDERVARPVTIPALAGIGAGTIHAAAVGAHADHRVLATMFVVLAVLQLATGVALLTQPSRAVAKAVVAINAVAVVGWLLSRYCWGVGDPGTRSRASGIRRHCLCRAGCVGGRGCGAGVERGHQVGFDVEVAPAHECS